MASQADIPEPATPARAPRRRSVSVVVPVYNGSATLPELVARIRDVLDERDIVFEIWLVNDGSRDESWSRIAALAAGDPRVHGLDLARNFGQHNALLAGIRAARHDATVTIDDDLQHPPEAIPDLLDKLDEGYDVVYASPVDTTSQPVSRRLSSWAIHEFLWRVLGSATERHSSSFRIFRTRVREAFADYRGAFVTIDALLTWGASRFTYIPVKHAARRHGQSNYDLRKLVTHGFNTVTNFSIRPLQVVSLIGFAFTLVGLSATAYAIGFYKLRGLTVPPDTFIFAVVCLFSGIQLFTLGIIGEYLARVHIRAMNKPAYVIREETGRDD